MRQAFPWLDSNQKTTTKKTNSLVKSEDIVVARDPSTRRSLLSCEDKIVHSVQ